MRVSCNAKPGHFRGDNAKRPGFACVRPKTPPTEESVLSITTGVRSPWTDSNAEGKVIGFRTMQCVTRGPMQLPLTLLVCYTYVEVPTAAGSAISM